MRAPRLNLNRPTRVCPDGHARSTRVWGALEGMAVLAMRLAGVALRPLAIYLSLAIPCA